MSARDFAPEGRDLTPHLKQARNVLALMDEINALQ